MDFASLTRSTGTCLRSKAMPPGIEQVLTNLLQNAFQATPRGGTVSLVARARGRLLEFVVQDAGHGIPEEHLERIFDPFFTTKGSGEGTGLGLSVSQTIVRRHRGTLVGENVPDWDGGGARFTVALPFLERRRIDRDSLEDEGERERAAPGGGPPRADHRGRRARFACRSGATWSASAGTWKKSADGAAGAARVLAERWDVVICDLQVPGQSPASRSTTRCRASNPELARRFVLITGDATAERSTRVPGAHRNDGAGEAVRAGPARCGGPAGRGLRRRMTAWAMRSGS